MKIVDLFCGEGGAAMGLHRAFPDAEIVGVDKVRKNRYPFEFVKGNALEFDLEGADLVWASPPCLKWTRMGGTNKSHQARLEDLITPTREKLERSGVPWVIENVEGAPLKNYVVLCGTMFGLKVWRHRLFECNPRIDFPPFTCNHEFRPTLYGQNWKRRRYESHHPDWVVVAGTGYDLGLASREMGIDWMTKSGLSQAVPPVYSQWIGEQLREAVEVAHA